ncbi:MAG: UbiH/UbiF/VisC/COQ6 family ubiquinone biosynthesis hydroxylase [Gammaproteobacteria bacterium]
MQTHDVMIVGGGMVGLTLALALAEQTSLSIAVLEARSDAIDWSPDRYQPRVSAIALSSVRIFKALKVWDTLVTKRVSPFTQISVWDAKWQGEIEFQAQDIAEASLGFIIENNLIQQVLLEKVKQSPKIKLISPVDLVSLNETLTGVELAASDGQTFKSKLVVGADGAHSWLRQQTGIDINQHDYLQKALVATVHTMLPHQQIARQVFLETGPLAFLPLASPQMSSIVWSLPTTDADYLKALNVDFFKQKLMQAFGGRLGEIVNVEQRFAFPLKHQQATQYVKSRVALIGDAAHTIHPLAGQGVNMGLLDACSLADVICDAQKARRDFSSIHQLRRFERWRKADNMPMLKGVDVIKQFFASDKNAIELLRYVGLETTNQLGALKNMFIRHAVGNRQDLPRLAL